MVGIAPEHTRADTGLDTTKRVRLRKKNEKESQYETDKAERESVSDRTNRKRVSTSQDEKESWRERMRQRLRQTKGESAEYDKKLGTNETIHEFFTTD